MHSTIEQIYGHTEFYTNIFFNIDLPARIKIKDAVIDILYNPSISSRLGAVADFGASNPLSS